MSFVFRGQSRGRGLGRQYKKRSADDVDSDDNDIFASSPRRDRSRNANGSPERERGSAASGEDKGMADSRDKSIRNTHGSRRDEEDRYRSRDSDRHSKDDRDRYSRDDRDRDRYDRDKDRHHRDDRRDRDRDRYHKDYDRDYQRDYDRHDRDRYERKDPSRDREKDRSDWDRDAARRKGSTASISLEEDMRDSKRFGVDRIKMGPRATLSLEEDKRLARVERPLRDDISPEKKDSNGKEESEGKKYADALAELEKKKMQIGKSVPIYEQEELAQQQFGKWGEGSPEKPPVKENKMPANMFVSSNWKPIVSDHKTTFPIMPEPKIHTEPKIMHDLISGDAGIPLRSILKMKAAEDAAKLEDEKRKAATSARMESPRYTEKPRHYERLERNLSPNHESSRDSLYGSSKPDPSKSGNTALPGGIDTLDIDDEDKFLYGDDEVMVSSKREVPSPVRSHASSRMQISPRRDRYQRSPSPDRKKRRHLSPDIDFRNKSPDKGSYRRSPSRASDRSGSYSTRNLSPPAQGGRDFERERSREMEYDRERELGRRDFNADRDLNRDRESRDRLMEDRKDSFRSTSREPRDRYVDMDSRERTLLSMDGDLDLREQKSRDMEFRDREPGMRTLDSKSGDLDFRDRRNTGDSDFRQRTVNVDAFPQSGNPYDAAPPPLSPPNRQEPAAKKKLAGDLPPWEKKRLEREAKNKGIPENPQESEPEHEKEPIAKQSKEEESSDPTIQNILKSIGFNFELSKLMQEKAQKERAKKDTEEFGIKESSSFMVTGLSLSGEDPKAKKRPSVESQASYADRAKRYMKELAIAKAMGQESPPPFSEVEKLRQDHAEQQRRKEASPRTRSPEDQYRSQSDQRFRSRERSRSRGRERYRRSRSRSMERLPSQEFLQSTRRSNRTPERYRSRSRSFSPSRSKSRGRYRSRSRSYSRSRSRSRTPTKRRRGDSFNTQDQFSNYGQGAQAGYPPFSQPPPNFQGSDHPGMYSSGYNQYPGQMYRGPQSPYGPSNMAQTYVGVPPDGEPQVRSNLRVLTGDSGQSSKISNRTVLPPKSEQVKAVRDKLVKDSSKPSDDSLEKRIVMLKSSSKPEPRASHKQEASEGKDSLEAKKAAKAMSPDTRAALLAEKTERQRRLAALEKELERLRRQQNELMRKRQRQKDGHKDPLLLENSKLQQEIATKISALRKAAEENVSALSSAVTMKEKDVDREVSKRETAWKSDKKEAKKDIALGSSKVKDEHKAEEEDILYEYFDPGNHWCRMCNFISNNVYHLFDHLQTKRHMTNINPYDRPWYSEQDAAVAAAAAAAKAKGRVQAAPLKGAEFMRAAMAYYCSLCRVFSGDSMCAEQHLKSQEHNKKYREHCLENSFYERRFNLDKAAGMSMKSVRDTLGPPKDEKPKFDPEKEMPKKVTQGADKKERVRESEKRKQEPRRKEQEEIYKDIIDLDPEPPVSKPAAPPTGKRTDVALKEQQPTKAKESNDPPTSEASNNTTTTEEKPSRKGISIKLTGKTGMNTKNANPLATLQKIPTRPIKPIITMQRMPAPVRPAVTQRVQAKSSEPASLDTFLSIDKGKGGQSVPLVVSMSELDDPSIRSRFSAAEREKFDEMKLLGIEPDKDSKPQPRPPPMLPHDGVKPPTSMATSNASGIYDVFFKSGMTQDTTEQEKKKDDDAESNSSEMSMDMGDFDIIDECGDE